MARKAIERGELEKKYREHFQKAINGQSPLACVLISTAFIENALMALLAGFFVECETAKRMFKGGGSLGDLSKCADMAYCLGFINKVMLENIKQVGEVRNVFAHSAGFIDFDHPSLKEALSKLTFPKISGDGPSMEQIAGNNLRDKFSMILVSLYSWILFALIGVKRQEKCDLDNVW
jgi:DNA-binding MltR family transcriptional regulator